MPGFRPDDATLDEILRWLNTGAFTRSKTNPKAAAAASVQAITGSGNAVSAIPRVASATMIKTSQTDDAITQRLGREFHKRRRSRTA